MGVADGDAEGNVCMETIALDRANVSGGKRVEICRLTVSSGVLLRFRIGSEADMIEKLEGQMCKLRFRLAPGALKGARTSRNRG